MSIYQHLLFLACVALATCADHDRFRLRPAAPAVFQLASVSEVANVVSVLSLVNAVSRGPRQAVVNWRLLAPALSSSLVGVVAGSRWPGSAVR